MKVLFVGEGNQDIGPAAGFAPTPRPATGVVPILARKVCAIIGESLALEWHELPRFNRAAKKHGFDAKVAAAMLIARSHGCDGLVCVADQDRHPERLSQMKQGCAGGAAGGAALPVACGLAVESIEAWTLGAPEAIAEELQVAVDDVRRQYPALHVEELYQKSGKQEHRPKDVLERLAGLKHRNADTAFRQAVAERTDAAALEQACPKGFKALAAELRSTFGYGP